MSSRDTAALLIWLKGPVCRTRHGAMARVRALPMATVWRLCFQLDLSGPEELAAALWRANCPWRGRKKGRPDDEAKKEGKEGAEQEANGQAGVFVAGPDGAQRRQSAADRRKEPGLW